MTVTPPLIVSIPWWKAALFRALRTALAVAIPYLGAVKFANVPWVTVGSAIGFAFLASILTSLLGIPETSGTPVPVWVALLQRCAKTFAQSLVAGFGTDYLIQQVAWPIVLQTASVATLASLIMGLVGFLPESPQADSILRGSVRRPVAASRPPSGPRRIAHARAKAPAGRK